MGMKWPIVRSRQHVFWLLGFFTANVIRLISYPDGFFELWQSSVQEHSIHGTGLIIVGISESLTHL